LAVTSAAANCLNNQEFEINLAFTGTGSNFSVVDDQGNAITGVSAGSYTFGPYVTGTVVAVTVTDSNGVACDTTISGLTADCMPLCDLAVTSAAANCLNNQEFEINLAFTGTGSNFSVVDDQGNAITGVSAGSYTFGPYVTGTVVAVTVTDSNGVACDTTISGLTADCTPLCDLAVTSAAANCTSDSTFDVTLTFTGTGSNFTVVDNQGGTLTGVSAGTYVIGPFASNTSVDVTITDQNGVNCDTTLSGLMASCAAPCDLVVTADANCTSQSTFSLDISIAGSGSLYEVSDNLGNNYGVFAPGSYQIGSYASGVAVDLSVVYTQDTTCTTTISNLVANCAPVCDLQVDTIFADCINQDSFAIRLVIRGSGSYTITDNLGNIETGIQGSTDTVSFSAYFNSTDVNITVTDANLPNCDTTFLSLTQDCTVTGDCDLAIDTAYVQCLSDTSFNWVVTFSGTDTNTYQVFDDLFLGFLQNVSPGTYTVGPFTYNPANPLALSIIVNRTDLFACSDSSHSLVVDCVVPPANSFCKEATVLQCGDLIEGSTMGAESDPSISRLCATNIINDVGVWYTYTGDGNMVSFTTCPTNPLLDTRISVFRGSCNNNFECLASNDDVDVCPGGLSRVNFKTTREELYFIYVSTNRNEMGRFFLAVECQAVVDVEPELGTDIYQGTVMLKWAVPSETDVEGYELQRSLMGEEFETLTFIPCESNSDDRMIYEFVDGSVHYNLTYTYRVKQTYMDGTVRYSNLAEAGIFGEPGVKVGPIYPNPTRTHANIDITAEFGGTLKYIIVDQHGHQLVLDEVELKSGDNTVVIDVSWLVSGVYYIKFMYGESKATRKMVLIR
ncbi:MAG: T9SS type A sorting domain-containing protein, partial [Bacteroidota bacterium]